LRIPNDADAEKRVKKMISMFNLQKCQDTFVGGQFKKGISGGEKKRVCIAVEMISDPALLILDEPTSGLDSSKARSVTKMLRNLALE
jgi:ABC-type multidrug transport system ATPase subunit